MCLMANKKCWSYLLLSFSISICLWMLFNYSLSPTGQTWHPGVFFQKYEKGAKAVKFLSDRELNQFISAPCCHIDSWKWNNLQDSALLISQSSLNRNTDDEIMTQHSLKISVSYVCTDKNDLIMRVCLCYYLFIYLLFFIGTFGCGTKLCWVWKLLPPTASTPPLFLKYIRGCQSLIPVSASHPTEDTRQMFVDLIWNLIIPVKSAEMTSRCITPIDDLVL